MILVPSAMEQAIRIYYVVLRSEEHADYVERLYKDRISESQQYKMAGNSIVVDVLMGIFQQMFDPKYVEESSQLSLW